jgi:hypothetical protein
LQSHFPNSLTKSFGNVMAHSPHFYAGTVIVGCRLYTTTRLDGGGVAPQNPSTLHVGAGYATTKR